MAYYGNMTITSSPANRKALIALDQSSKAVGWVVFLDGEFESSGVLKPDPPNFDLLRTWVKDMVSSLRNEGYVPEVIVESIYLAFFGGKPQAQTFKVLSQTQAHIWAAARDSGVNVVEVSAYDAMRSLTGITKVATKREVRKEAMITAAKDFIGYDVSEHESDALGLALHFLETEQAISL